MADSPSADRAAALRRLLDIVEEITLTRHPDAREESRLLEDLGVESIDLLDILFKAEAEFGVSLSPTPAFLDPRFFDERAGQVCGGALTEAGREALRAWPGLNTACLSGPGAARYLGTVAALLDLLCAARPTSLDAPGGHG